MSKLAINPLVQELSFDEKISVVKEALVMYHKEYILESSRQEEWLWGLEEALAKQHYNKITDNAVDMCWKIVRGDYNENG